MSSRRRPTLSALLATALLVWLLVPLRAASARHWVTKSSPESGHPTLYILPPHIVSAEDLEDDQDREVSVVVPTLVESPRPMAWNAGGARPGNLRPAMNKRQVRYHQCYFNPISCFG